MDKLFSVFIVEDELLIAEMLKDLLEELGYSVVGIATDFDEAMQFLEAGNKPNICFLDINLENDKNGLDVAREIKNKYQLPIAFITSYADESTIKKAAEFEPEAYIVKPFNSIDLLTNVEIIKKRLNRIQVEKNYIFIKDKYTTIKVDENDILYIISDNIYIEVYTVDNKKFIIRQTLDGFLTELKSAMIMRTHRSYAVNLIHVKGLNSEGLIFAERTIPISRNFREEILTKFKESN